VYEKLSPLSRWGCVQQRLARSSGSRAITPERLLPSLRSIACASPDWCQGLGKSEILAAGEGKVMPMDTGDGYISDVQWFRSGHGKLATKTALSPFGERYDHRYVRKLNAHLDKRLVTELTPGDVANLQCSRICALSRICASCLSKVSKLPSLKTRPRVILRPARLAPLVRSQNGWADHAVRS